LPSRRTENNRMTKSCTQPPSTAPAMIQSVPGRYPNWAASTGPTSGPGPAMAAKWCPKTTHLLVGTKSRPLWTLGGGGAQGIEGQHFGGNKTAVEAISDGVGGDGGDEQADGDPEKNAQHFWHEARGPVANIVAKRSRVRKPELCFGWASVAGLRASQSSVIT
jgi:hypothetical protein